MAADPRVAMASAIVTEPWTRGPLPPRRARGEQRDRRQVRLPFWLWEDIEELSRASGLSRDELLALILFKFLRDATVRRPEQDF